MRLNANQRDDLSCALEELYLPLKGYLQYPNQAHTRSCGGGRHAGRDTPIFRGGLVERRPVFLVERAC